MGIVDRRCTKGLNARQVQHKLPMRNPAAESQQGQRKAVKDSTETKVTVVQFNYVIVGAGSAGLNALQAILETDSQASILIIDKHDNPGGSWNDFYPYAKLHQPHIFFGVSGLDWDIEDPSTLASRAEVLSHFQDYTKSAEERFDVTFRWQCTFVGASRMNTTRWRVEVRTLNTNTTALMEASHVIDARAFNYDGRYTSSGGKVMSGIMTSTSHDRVIECEPEQLPCVVDANPTSCLFVVIGGGKTGMDSALYLLDNAPQGSEICIVTGRSKYFINRDFVYQQDRSAEGHPALWEIWLSTWLKYDGNNAHQLFREMEREGSLLRVGSDEPCMFMGGVLSCTEAERIRSGAVIVDNDYFLKVEDLAKHTRVILKHGSPIETNKQVVLINCRSSFQGRENAFTKFEHPVASNGILTVGTLLGVSTGANAYILTKLMAASQLDHMKFWAAEDTQKSTLDFQIKLLLCGTLNWVMAMQKLGSHQVTTLDLSNWQQSRKGERATSFLSALPMLTSQAQRFCRMLMPISDPNGPTFGAAAIKSVPPITQMPATASPAPAYQIMPTQAHTIAATGAEAATDVPGVPSRRSSLCPETAELDDSKTTKSCFYPCSVM